MAEGCRPYKFLWWTFYWHCWEEVSCEGDGLDLVVTFRCLKCPAIKTQVYDASGP